MFNRLFKEIELAEEAEFQETALDNILAEDKFDELVLQFMEKDLIAESTLEKNVIDEEDFEEEEEEDVDIEELLENVFDII